MCVATWEMRNATSNKGQTMTRDVQLTCETDMKHFHFDRQEARRNGKEKKKTRKKEKKRNMHEDEEEERRKKEPSVSFGLKGAVR